MSILSLLYLLPLFWLFSKNQIKRLIAYSCTAAMSLVYIAFIDHGNTRYIDVGIFIITLLAVAEISQKLYKENHK